VTRGRSETGLTISVPTGGEAGSLAIWQSAWPASLSACRNEQVICSSRQVDRFTGQVIGRWPMLRLIDAGRKYDAQKYLVRASRHFTYPDW
jgi:hypothetical protein